MPCPKYIINNHDCCLMLCYLFRSCIEMQMVLRSQEDELLLVPLQPG